MAVDPILASLADPARRRVVELLGDRPHRAGELAHRVGVGRPAMSRHLRVLRQHGVVEAETPDDDARARIYRLRGDRIDDLQRWLAEVRAHWSEQLTRFQRHVEGRVR